MFELIAFGPDIWLVERGQLRVIGFAYPTRMTVIRLADQSLFIWSPCALDTALRQQIDALGAVRYVIAPNTLHHMHLSDWQSAYPQASFFGAPGLLAKRPDIRFDDELGVASQAGWANEIDQQVIPGNLITTEVVFFHRASGTVLFTDLLQQFPDNWFSGWRRWVARLDLMVGDEPHVPRKFRTAFVNRGAARAAIAKVLDWPAQNVVIAHGSPVTQNARAFLRRAFGWLIKPR